MAEPDRLVVGRIGKPQGIRGEVTVEVRTDDPESRFAPGTALLTDPPERGPLTVAAARTMPGKYVLTLEGVSDRSGAEQLRGTVLLVDVGDLPPLTDPDEYYDSDLVGLQAVTTDGALIGVVGEVLHLPGGDVLAITRTDGPEALVPFLRAMVPTVDVAGGRLVIDPPAGLLDLP